MFDIFKNIRGLLEVERVKIDNQVIRLHYTFTVLILLVFTLIVSTQQLSGDPIQCAKSDELPSEIINTYCWVYSTYIIPGAFNKKVGVEVPDPGIDATQDESKFRYLQYYQWVAFMLMFQAAMFYAPRWFWLTWENSKLQTLISGLEVGIMEEEEKVYRRKLLADYFMCSWKTHDWYARKFFICEVLCLLNVIGEFLVLDAFLYGQFIAFGADAVRYYYFKPDTISPLLKVFPRVSKCRFMKYGPSGSIEKYDAMCVMALNNMNEKIHLFLWFWFVLLMILTSMTVIYHFLLFTSPQARVYMICRTYGFDRKKSLRNLVREASFGDWFLIYMLGKNIDFMIYRDLVYEIAARIDNVHRTSSEDLEKQA